MKEKSLALLALFTIKLSSLVQGRLALFALVTFLRIIKKLVHFELAGHLEITRLVVCCMYQCFRMSDESSFILREAFVKVKVAKLISFLADFIINLDTK